MDIEVTYTDTCICGRNVVGASGRCAECIAEGRALLELYLTGKISMAKYVRELRRVRKAHGTAG
jgi:hypothetical protein